MKPKNGGAVNTSYEDEEPRSDEDEEWKAEGEDTEGDDEFEEYEGGEGDDEEELADELAEEPLDDDKGEDEESKDGEEGESGGRARRAQPGHAATDGLARYAANWATISRLASQPAPPLRQTITYLTQPTSIPMEEPSEHVEFRMFVTETHQEFVQYDFRNADQEAPNRRVVLPVGVIAASYEFLSANQADPSQQ